MNKNYEMPTLVFYLDKSYEARQAIAYKNFLIDLASGAGFEIDENVRIIDEMPFWCDLTSSYEFFLKYGKLFGKNS
jgi:hypothetical protein